MGKSMGGLANLPWASWELGSSEVSHGGLDAVQDFRLSAYTRRITHSLGLSPRARTPHNSRLC